MQNTAIKIFSSDNLGKLKTLTLSKISRQAFDNESSCTTQCIRTALYKSCFLINFHLQKNPGSSRI